MFTEASQLNLIKSCLSLEEIQDILLLLFEISGLSKGKLSFNAASLYN